jgi:hypothetical protein
LSKTFTWAVQIDEIADRDRDLHSEVRVNIVRFNPGSRPAGHSYAVGRTLRITEGLGRTQARGGEVITIRFRSADSELARHRRTSNWIRPIPSGSRP